MSYSGKIKKSSLSNAERYKKWSHLKSFKKNGGPGSGPVEGQKRGPYGTTEQKEKLDAKYQIFVCSEKNPAGERISADKAFELGGGAVLAAACSRGYSYGTIHLDDGQFLTLSSRRTFS